MGALVRNFGMVWTIGQPAGELQETAQASNRAWREVLANARLWHDPCGSLHLAYHELEQAVLKEFHSSASIRITLLGPEDVTKIAPQVDPTGLHGGLFSPEELCVDPREVVAKLPGWLKQELDVDFTFHQAVTQVKPGSLVVGGRLVEAARIIVCSGDDYQTLLPDHFADSGLGRCKLQMMRARPAVEGWRIGPMLCAGLTLTHYKNFADCPSLPALREQLANEWPEHVRHGIHVLVSQFGTGEVTLGDTHEYGDAPTPFSDERLDRLVLDYLGTFLRTECLEVVSRWVGVYSTYAHGAFYEAEPLPGVHVLTGVGGAGMTLSFGLAERTAAKALSVGAPGPKAPRPSNGPG
jgi:FAD dependent oxidoreductase TIGR03364